MVDILHELTNLQGIGPARAEQLRSAGAVWAEDLFLLNQLAFRRRLITTGFPMGNLLTYRLMAELLQIPGVDNQFAEALAKGPFQSLQGFGTSEVSEVQSILGAAKQDGLIPDEVDDDKVRVWQRDAVEVAYLRRISGRVVDEHGVPVVGATITVAKRWATTASDGRFVVNRVEPTKTRVLVVADGKMPLELPVSVSDQHQVRLTMKAGSPPPPVVIDEHAGELIRSLGPADALDFKQVDLSALPPGTPVQFRSTYRDGTQRVQSVWRKKTGSNIEVLWARVPAGTVPGSPAPTDVFLWDGSAMTDTEKDVMTMREEARFAHFADYEMGTI